MIANRCSMLFIAVLFAAAAQTAIAQAPIVRASIGTGGVQANRSSGPVLCAGCWPERWQDAFAFYGRGLAIDRDGNFVAFTSEATNLVPGDTNPSPDVFVRDVLAGTTTRVSIAADGSQANNASHVGDIAGGRFVLFVSAASNLVPNDTNSEYDVFVRDRDTDADGVLDEPGEVAVVRINVANDGTQADRPSTVGPSSLSADGRFAVFASRATTLAPGLSGDHTHIYVRDLLLRTTTRLSVAADGTPGNGDSLRPTMSADGRFVAFTSNSSNLVAGDTNDTCQTQYPPTTGQNCHDVFVRDRDTDGDGVFDEADAVSTTRVSVASNGTQANDLSGAAALSGDGRFVVFHSWASNLVLNDTNGLDDLFLHDRSNGTTTRIATVGIVDRDAPSIQVGIDGDGMHITFNSPSRRNVPGDTNETHDVSVYERGTGVITRVSLTVDRMEANGPSHTPVISANGARVAFLSQADNLVPGDTNEVQDVFVADRSILPRDADNDQLPDSWEQRFGVRVDSALGEDGPNGDPDNDGVTNAAELQAGTHPRGFSKRYFAEGATIGGFSTRIALFNPNAVSTAAVVEYRTSVGESVVQNLVLAPRGREAVCPSLGRYCTTPPSRELDDAEFSTVVESDLQVVADRTMFWAAERSYSAHSETAVLAPALTWYLAEGATHSGFDLFYLLQNPNTTAAQVEVTFLLPSGTPVVRTYTVEASSRFTIWVDLVPGLDSTDVSAIIRVTNGQPIIVERAMYLSAPDRPFTAAHESAGVTAPATKWFLAEGATGNYFDLFVLIANPGDETAIVKATYLLPDGRTLEKQYTVAAQSRFNVWVDLEDPRLRDTAVSTTIESLNGVPIIVERSMWWPGDVTTWHGAHNSPGATSTGVIWAMAEGETHKIYPLDRQVSETFILIANTSPFDATVKVTLLFGWATAERTFLVGANSRFNFWVSPAFEVDYGRSQVPAEGPFAAIAESIGDVPAQLVVERAMYFDQVTGGAIVTIRTIHWAAGTNALATKLR